MTITYGCDVEWSVQVCQFIDSMIRAVETIKWCSHMKIFRTYFLWDSNRKTFYEMVHINYGKFSLHSHLMDRSFINTIAIRSGSNLWHFVKISRKLWAQPFVGSKAEDVVGKENSDTKYLSNKEQILYRMLQNVGHGWLLDHSNCSAVITLNRSFCSLNTRFTCISL